MMSKSIKGNLPIVALLTAIIWLAHVAPAAARVTGM